MIESPWYVEAFRSDYRDVYAHRNLVAAREEVRWLVEDALRGVDGPVLDDCCGFGRHALALAEHGHDVFGIDLSRDLLAGSRDLEGGVERLGGRLAQADMRALPFPDATFAAVVNLFTSFGYLGDEGDDAALAEMARVLAPGGVLVMDLMNPEAIRRGLRPRSREERGGIVLEAARALEDGGRRVVKDVRLTLADGEVRTWREEVRMFDPEEIDARLAALGLEVRRRAGNFAGEPFDAGSSARQIVVATR
ncbi:MAG: class I SAM-dependent methyltransferase [Planctomycetota bacterium]